MAIDLVRIHMNKVPNVQQHDPAKSVPTDEQIIKYLNAEPPEADKYNLPSRRGDLTWELVTTFPRQGWWTVEEYLSREFDGLVEYVDGVLEFLPECNWQHQQITDLLHRALKKFVDEQSLGHTAFAPIPIRISNRLYRMPDVLFVRRARFRGVNQPPDGADLVMEILDDDPANRSRDLIDKRRDYALAGIPEYWIVDPKALSITVLILEKNEYAVHGEFRWGSTVSSMVLPGFEIGVTDCFTYVLI